MASTSPSQELPAPDTFEQSQDTTVSVKPNSSQEGSLEDGKSDKPSYTIKEVQDETSKHISSHWKIILGYGALVSILMIGIAVAMLCIIVSFKMDLLNVETFSSGHFYFLRNVPTSAIICITSLGCLSSILFFPSLLKLSSFSYAHDLLVNSSQRHYDRLPNTQDFAMLLRVLAGEEFVLAFRRSFAKPTSGRRMIRKVTILSSIAMSLSLIIILCNICVSTSTRALQSPFDHQGGVANFGRTLSSDCLQASGANNCQSRADLHAGNKSEAGLTMKGLSDQNKIVQLDFNGLPGFYNETVMIMADIRAPKGSIFTAATYGVSTMFMDIGAECEVNAQSWNCSDHKFDGNFTSPLTMPKSQNLHLHENVVMWVVAGRVDGPDGTFKHFTNDSNYAVAGNASTLLTVMHCETSVWEVEYLKFGEEFIPQAIKPARADASKLVFSPVFPGMIEGYHGFDLDDLRTEFSARAVQSVTPEKLAHGWAESFAKLAISSSAGIMEQIPVTQDLPVITAVRQAPFILLGAASFVYGILALGLVLNAIRVVVAVPGVRDIQARMGISGLVASALEPDKALTAAASLEELLSNDNYVGVYKTAAGGYKWDTGKMA